MSNITIYNGNFVNVLDEFPDGLILTDPPYNQNYKYNTYKDNLKTSEYIELLSNLPLPAVIIHYPEETINILPKAFKTDVSDIITWFYNSNTHKQSRLISFWGCKSNLDYLKQPAKNQNDKRVKNLKVRSYDYWHIQQVKNISKTKYNHPCQLPEQLIKNILSVVRKSDNTFFDTIIDPFMGTGTVLKIALEMGYKVFGCEIDEKYFKICEDRLSTYQIDLFGDVWTR
jgi:site-specific DNA-methyltransferase (adenine-specific)